MNMLDHLALGHFLLSEAEQRKFHCRKRAFLLGNVEPDFNVVTYMYGIKKEKKPCGHNAEYALKHIAKSLNGFQKGGVQTTKDFYLLGTIMHYAADAFTFPHNLHWSGGLSQHAAYEASLHENFTEKLKISFEEEPHTEFMSIFRYVLQKHMEYKNTHPGIETDCNYIISVCRTIFLRILYGDIF